MGYVTADSAQGQEKSLPELVAQVVSRRPAEREVSCSIPDASRPSVCRPRLRPPGAGMGSRAAVALEEEKDPCKWAPMGRWGKNE